jgi:hypothetical protein
MWIDSSNVEVDEIGFLQETFHENTGSKNYRLTDRPPKTNRSFEYKLEGWCGTYNNVATYGRGVWKIIKTLPNERIHIEEVLGDERNMFLKEMGFPELVDSELVPLKPDSVQG